MSTLTVKYYIEIPSASPDNNKGDVDRINLQIQSSTGIGNIDWPLDIIGTVHHTLHSSGGKLTVTAAPGKGRLKVVTIEPGNTTGVHFGLAVDLGTTVIAAELIDLNTGKMIAGAGDINGQVQYGEDLLTRLHLSSKGGVDKLRQAMLDTINKLIGELCSSAEIEPSQISGLCAAGNTSMTHMLLGIDPSPILHEPYTPIINHVPEFTAKELGIDIAPNAVAFIFPNASSFLGGDLISGLIASGIAERDEISLLVDIGTNVEVILGNKEWLLAVAGSAGPALEGGVAECAIRAKPGAIERVKIDRNTFEPIYSTISNQKPIGLCGSGLIDTVAELYLSGLLDPTGRFDLGQKTDRWKTINGKVAYILYEDEAPNGTHMTYITEKDIQNLLRTKAAMVAALTVLLDSVGLDIDSIARVYTAGSFGIHLSVDSATAIGLYPRIPAERFVSLGNGSLAGAGELLKNADRIEDARLLADKITYLELNIHPGFMEIFRSAKYL